MLDYTQQFLQGVILRVLGRSNNGIPPFSPWTRCLRHCCFIPDCTGVPYHTPLNHSSYVLDRSTTPKDFLLVTIARAYRPMRISVPQQSCQVIGPHHRRTVSVENTVADQPNRCERAALIAPDGRRFHCSRRYRLRRGWKGTLGFSFSVCPSVGR